MARRLNHVVSYRRRSHIANAVTGLASGIGHAYRNRNQLWKLGQDLNRAKNEVVALKNKAVAAKNKFLSKKKQTKPMNRRNINHKTASAGKTLGQSADNQRKYVSYSSGKKLSVSSIVDKTVNASLQRNIFFWRNYTVEATTAAYNLGLDNAIGGTTHYHPLYMFDLTARPQWPNRGLVNAVFGYRAVSSTTPPGDGRIVWQQVAGIDAVNASSVNVQIDEATALSTIQSSGKSLINWLDIKANLQGARSVPTTITFELIKLLDADLDPINNQTVASSNDQHQVYWQSEVASCTVNPIHTYQKPKKSYVKILASKKFTFQPRESIDNDVRGQMTVLKWFNRINKIIDYNNKGNLVQDDVAYNTTALINNPGGETVSVYADTKDKIYLRVKAYSVFNPAGGFSSALHPSFELNARMCHSTLV